MYACICHAVTVDTIAAAVDDGADTIEAISAQTQAGSSCRCCHEHLEEIIESRCQTCPMRQFAVA